MMHAFLFTVLCLSWGSTWIAIKVGVDLVPPFFLAGTRFLAAGILILAAVRIVSGREALRVDRADIPSLLWMSAMVVSICFALIFWGERFVTASVAAIVVQGMIPILLPLFAFLLHSEPLGRNRLASILLGIAGLGCIFYPGLAAWIDNAAGLDASALQLPGLLAILVGTLAYCYGSVWGRPLLSRSSAVAIAGWHNLIGGVLILLMTLVLELPVRPAGDFAAILLPEALLAWLWLVVVGSAIGFVLYVVLLKAWGPARVSPYAFVTPVVTLVLDHLLFGRTIGGMQMAGTMVILLGVCVGMVRPRQLRAPA